MPLLGDLALFALTLVLSVLITPGVIRLCRAQGALDKPGERKVHRSGVPRLGGVAIFVAMSLGMTAAVYGVLGDIVDLSPLQGRLIPAIYVGLCGFFFIGFFDDLRSLPAIPRLVAQFATATAVVLLSGGSIRIAGAFGHIVFPVWLAVIITVLWIVGVVNTFNWIDGLDGLAAGIAGISATAFFVIAILKPGLPNAPLTAALCAMLIGAVLGFLPYNFFPAKTFIGDGGAFSLGYLLAVISVVGLFKQAALVGFVLPVVVLALPITDTLLAILRRAIRGQPITQPDSKHIHHRLLALYSRRYRAGLPQETLSRVEERLLAGRAHRNTVLALYAFAAFFAGFAVILGIYA